MRHDKGIAIDIWDVETFDSELRGDLGAHADYMLTSCHQRLEREAFGRSMPYPEDRFQARHVDQGAYDEVDGSPHDPRLALNVLDRHHLPNTPFELSA